MNKILVFLFSVALISPINAMDYQKPPSKEESLGNEVFKEQKIKTDPSHPLAVMLCASGVAAGQSPVQIFASCKQAIKKNCKIVPTPAGPVIVATSGIIQPACNVFAPLLLL